MKSCERCGDEFKAPTRNTRYCPICRIVRDIGAMKITWSKNCEVCSEEFFPVRKTYDLCPNCTVIRGHGDVECALCGEKNKLALGLERTCIFCVSASGKNRESYKKTLQALVAQKIKEKAKYD